MSKIFLSLYLALVVISGMFLAGNRKKPANEDTVSPGEPEITQEIEPLTESILTMSKRPFEKTTPQAVSQGFNYNMIEFYKVDHGKNKDQEEESLFYKIYSKDNGVKTVSHFYLYGKNFEPDNCGVYSFLETSNTVFVICRDNNLNRNSDGNMWIAGLASPERNEYDHSDRRLNLILKEKFPAVRGNFNTFSEASISQVALHKYYLSTNEKIYVIGFDKTGTVMEMKEIGLGYVSGNKDRGYALSVKYNQTGNLVIFSDRRTGGIIDTNDDKSLEVDDSCVAVIDPERKNRDGFYNNQVDPFSEGPYKGVSEVPGKINTFEQGVSNSGCVRREGYIRLYRSQDTGYCEIEVENELVGC